MEFNEPWVAIPWDDGKIRDATGNTVLCVQYLEVRDRIVACVNACAGYSTEDLNNGTIELIGVTRDGTIKIYSNQEQK
jgi:hypothetical protein